MNNGIQSGNFFDSQFMSFSQQNSLVQQKSIQIYAQNLAKNHHDSMRNAEGISDRQSSAKHKCEFRSESSDVYFDNDFDALQTQVDDVSSDLNANEAESAYITFIMQTHVMSFSRSNELVVNSSNFSE
jgi:hypothetical protein